MEKIHITQSKMLFNTANNKRKEIVMKEKLSIAFGLFGVILYYGIALISFSIPLFVITESFWLQLLFFWIMYFIPISEIVFWPWGLYIMINGPQDIFAIIYYILFAVSFLPMFISSVMSLFSN